MNTNLNAEKTHDPEFDPVVDLLDTDALLHARAADAGLESRIASATVSELSAARHPRTLRFASETSPRHRRQWVGGLRLAAAVAFVATLTAAFVAVRGPASASTSGTVIATAGTPTAVEDWDILLGGETLASLAAGSESLLKESETIGKRWSNEYSESDWTILDEGSM